MLILSRPRPQHLVNQPLVAVPLTVARAFARAVATTGVTCCATAVAFAAELPPARCVSRYSVVFACTNNVMANLHEC